MASASGFSGGSSFSPRFLLRALKYRNYRLFFLGQIVSLIGTWLTMVATSWLVYRLAKEHAGSSLGSAAFVLGVVGFASQVPQLLLAPIAGVWADRFPKQKLLVTTQFLSMLQSIGLSALALTHEVTIPHVIVLNVFQGIVNAFDMPARQAFVVEMVENRDDLSNAIALSSSMVHAARLIGPAVGGFLIYHYGEASCFVVDSVSYLGVLIALLYMRVKPVPPKPAAKMSSQVKEGFAYAWGFGPIRALLLLTSITSIFYMSLTTLLPILSDEVLGGQERVYGLLLGASGLGALFGAVWLASRKSVLGLGGVISRANIGLGLSLLVLAVSRSLAVSLFVLVISGLCMVLQMASSNTVLQTIVDSDKRGRVMSFFGMAFLGMAPIGSLVSGALADVVGTAPTIALSGAAVALAGLVFRRKLPQLKQHVRPIYEKLGLYGEVPSPLPKGPPGVS